MFVQFLEMDGSDGNATVLIAPAVQGPLGVSNALQLRVLVRTSLVGVILPRNLV